MAVVQRFIRRTTVWSTCVCTLFTVQLRSAVYDPGTMIIEVVRPPCDDIGVVSAVPRSFFRKPTENRFSDF